MIPVCTPLLGKREIQFVLDCLKTNWISSSGQYIKRFEEGFSRYCQRQYGVTTTNGTAALHLALAALEIGPGDEVIVPTFTIASVAFAAVYCGAKPVFVDVQQDTWNIDPTLIEQKITKKTRAIIVVHTYGHPCEMDPILKIARKHQLFVVEDAAEAHGAEYRGRKVGSFGDCSCFSFYGNKIITTGEGGMVLTDSPKLAQRCQRLKNLSFLESKRFWHEEVGFNYRMTNIQAALGAAQLETIDEMAGKRRQNAFRYNVLLSQIPGITLPVERQDVKNVYWMYGILVDRAFGMSRKNLMAALKEKGIETRTFFLPLNNQPVFKKLRCADSRRFPIAEDIAKRGLYLPSGSGLTRKEIEYVCNCIGTLQRSR